MIKNDMDNRHDDWLKKELEEEKKTTVWDFDGVRKPAAVYNEPESLRSASDIKESKDAAQAIIWFVLDIFLAVGLALINTFTGNQSFLPPVILFLMINPGIFVWVFLFKRFPPTWYLIMGALIAVVLEVATVLEFLR